MALIPCAAFALRIKVRTLFGIKVMELNTVDKQSITISSIEITHCQRNNKRGVKNTRWIVTSPTKKFWQCRDKKQKMTQNEKHTIENKLKTEQKQPSQKTKKLRETYQP